MKRLKIQENIRAELINKNIVICSYYDNENNIVDCIDLKYSESYPDFEEVEVFLEQN